MAWSPTIRAALIAGTPVAGSVLSWLRDERCDRSARRSLPRARTAVLVVLAIGPYAGDPRIASLPRVEATRDLEDKQRVERMVREASFDGAVQLVITNRKGALTR
jgi:hypothetical protein